MKEEIWERGGGNWLVGKVNVGKSNLFETVFPKRRNEKVSSSKLRGAAQDEEDRRNDAETGKFPRENFDHRGQRVLEAPDDQGEDVLEGDLLLPPSQPERAFPVMPIISSLPGTTASPIRLPFGHGKGELIDLPGLARGDLDSYIQPEHKLDIVMRNRIKPEQLVLKPGQSLLLGGLIRITPISDGITMLAYTFLPLKVHKTATEKAISIQTQQRESGVDTIMEQGVGQKIKSAGTYQLEWDVTKQRSGPLTASSVVGMKADNLPYRILSTDILIEGCGWVELSAQVRKKKDTQAAVGNEDFPAEAEGKAESQDIVGGLKDVEVVPEVEIFTPEGKYVGSRRPMNAWLFLAEKSPGPKRKGRPRQSMKGQKKANKLARR
ncbi:MAG: hypothetical protein M1827_005004 [Pycnora praestabilis]|nr:MAG: hypothetical protein M1827_005004 [Pycnora praestabilis]